MVAANHESILFEDLKKGNVKIYDYLFHLYYSGMVVFVEKYNPDRATAEDIVQKFFVKLWVNRERLHIDTSLKAYFFSSVKNYLRMIVYYTRMGFHYTRMGFYSLGMGFY